MKYTLSFLLVGTLMLTGASCSKDEAVAPTTTTPVNTATATTNTSVSATNTNTTANINPNTNAASNSNDTRTTTTTSGVTPSTTNDGGLEEPAASGATTYSVADIAKHSTKTDCFTAINGKVYDVTKFIARHPGGAVITEACGKDGSQLFATQGGEGQHSSTARSQLATFEIGTLK